MPDTLQEIAPKFSNHPDDVIDKGDIAAIASISLDIAYISSGLGQL
jgi:hypothetical protein